MVKKRTTVCGLFILAICAYYGVARAEAIDVYLLGDPSTLYGGIQILCCGVDPRWGTLTYSSAAAVVTVGLEGYRSRIDLQIAGTSESTVMVHLVPVVGGMLPTDLASGWASIAFTSPAPPSIGLYPITSAQLATQMSSVPLPAAGCLRLSGLVSQHSA